MGAELQFNKKQSVYTFPRWVWPVLGPYAGSSGYERIRSWQVEGFLVRNGWLLQAQRCSITGGAKSVVFHSEDYLAPWKPLPVTRGVHIRIHQRFRHPNGWRAFLEAFAAPGCWAFGLSCEQQAVTPRTAGAFVDLVSKRAPIPAWVSMPWAEIYRDDEHPALDAPMTTDEVARFIASHKWTFARTLSHIPHEYIVKPRCSDLFDFERFCCWIASVGVRRRFRKAWYVYADFEGWSYFTMGCTLSATTVINRARPEGG